MPSLQDIDEQMPKQMGRTNRGKKIYCMETEAWLQTTLSELASAAAFAKAEHETIVDDDAFPFLDINDLDDIFAEVAPPAIRWTWAREAFAPRNAPSG